MLVHFFFNTLQPYSDQMNNISLGIWFTGPAIYNISIDFQYISFFSALGYVYFTFANLKGFTVSPLASPCVLVPYDWMVHMVSMTLEINDFDFYTPSGRKLGSNCDDYLMSYYNLTQTEFEAADKLGLAQSFRGTFSFSMQKIEFSSALNPLSPKPKLARFRKN